MSNYKTRNSFMTYDVYLKKRETTCHYNRGLYWMDASGSASLLWETYATRSFQKAICADPHNEDAKYQLNILKADNHALNCPLLLDCSGCQWVNSQES